MCTPYLAFIINIYSIAISLFRDWRVTQCAEHMLAELLCTCRAGIGQQLCHSNCKYSPTSSVLLSWCSQGREGNGSLLCESPELPQPAPYHLSLTYCAETRLRGSCAAHASPLAPLCLCLCEQLHFSSFKSFTLCGAVSFYLWCFSGVASGGGFVLGRWSSDGRQCWLWLGLGMLNGGREGLFELGQQLQQQGEYQAALHCFLSCLLGLTHVQSFTSLPNCLHQVSHMPEDWTHTLIAFVHLSPFPSLTHTHTYKHACAYALHASRKSAVSWICTAVHTFASLLFLSIIN